MNLLKVLSNPQEAMQDAMGGQLEGMLSNIEPGLIMGALSNMVTTAVLQEALRRQPTQTFIDTMTQAGYSQDDAFGLWALVLKEAVVQ